VWCRKVSEWEWVRAAACTMAFISKPNGGPVLIPLYMANLPCADAPIARLAKRDLGAQKHAMLVQPASINTRRGRAAVAPVLGARVTLPALPKSSCVCRSILTSPLACSAQHAQWAVLRRIGDKLHQLCGRQVRRRRYFAHRLVCGVSFTV
jgi:hypothetical protein